MPLSVVKNPLVKPFHRFFNTFFFGNYFYGICAVALLIEAGLQQGFTLSNPVWYLLVFSSTVLYYSFAYLNEKQKPNINPRTIWYKEHDQLLFWSQRLLLCVAFFSGIYLTLTFFPALLAIPYWQIVCILFFPALSIWYYADAIPWVRRPGLRSMGWMKPFVIGFIWAAVVTVYPAIFAAIENNTVYQPGLFNLLLFVKNGMFITMLCILFDIKDYATDHNAALKTFVVQFGLRKTLFYIIIPLTVIGLGMFLYYGFTHHFPLLRMIINTIPFILLITVTYHMHRRKSILYYLAIIDGLMLIKAICGITGTFIHA